MFLCVALLVAITTLEYTERSEFCITCHLMKPYYLSYQSSPHKEVESCLDCHYEPGLVGHIKGKAVDGSVSLFRYITGMYTLPIESDISSELCFRCHEIDKTIDYKGVQFEHWHEIENGEKKCGFCHSENHNVVPHAECNECHEGVVHGNETEIDMGLCMNCHSKRGISNNCETCHDNGYDFEKEE